MRFLRLFSFIGAFIISFLTHAEMECPIDEDDLISVGEQTVDYLNSWCSDAWCAGDFQHVFLNFVFNSEQGIWVLDLLSFPHELTDPLESVTAMNNVSSRQIMVRLSTCSFPSPDPSEMLRFKTGSMPLRVLGITDQMSESLVNCTTEVERLARL